MNSRERTARPELEQWTKSDGEEFSAEHLEWCRKEAEEALQRAAEKLFGPPAQRTWRYAAMKQKKRRRVPAHQQALGARVINPKSNVQKKDPSQCVLYHMSNFRSMKSD